MLNTGRYNQIMNKHFRYEQSKNIKYKLLFHYCKVVFSLTGILGVAVVCLGLKIVSLEMWLVILTRIVHLHAC